MHFLIGSVYYIDLTVTKVTPVDQSLLKLVLLSAFELTSYPSLMAIIWSLIDAAAVTASVAERGLPSLSTVYPTDTSVVPVVLIISVTCKDKGR